jgi:nucleoid-associated protein YgaU
MVVTVLVFAFGFLVYHKVDLHQRSLTQAAIAGPRAAEPAAQPISRATAAVSADAADPLPGLASASDQSPFMNLSEPSVEPTLGASGDTEPGFADTTPAEPPSSDAGVQHRPGDEPTMVLTEATAPENEPSFEVTQSEPATAAEPPAFAMTDSANPEPVLPAAESVTPGASEDSAVPSFPETDAGQFVATEPALEPIDTNGDTLAIAANTVEFTGTESTTAPLGSGEPTAAGSFPAETSATTSTLPTEEQASTEEPMLLALAEPQESNGFTTFTPDEPAPRAPASEPVFGDVREPAAATPRTSGNSGGFSGSAGFDAVARPAARPSRQALRSASGTGSDGKFDLAAFNYQNSPQANPASDAADVPTVVVQEGENYTKLSKRVYGTTRYFSALAVFNQHRIPDPRRMRPGMIVLTPDRRILEDKYPQLFVDSLPRIAEPPGFLLLEDGSAAYRVGERETLSDISKKHLGRASRWIELYEMNRAVVNDPNRLKPGTILALPDDATEVLMMP